MLNNPNLLQKNTKLIQKDVKNLEILLQIILEVIKTSYWKQAKLLMCNN